MVNSEREGSGVRSATRFPMYNLWPARCPHNKCETKDVYLGQQSSWHFASIQDLGPVPLFSLLTMEVPINPWGAM